MSLISVLFSDFMILPWKVPAYIIVKCGSHNQHRQEGGLLMRFMPSLLRDRIELVPLSITIY